MIPQELTDCIKNPTGSKAQLAVFDFDGTSISGNSPVLLVRYLMKRKMLDKRVIAKIISWAFAYKFRLPQNETWVRGLVFSAFEGLPRSEVDAFLRGFYDECIDLRFRMDAEAAMRAHEAEGHVVLVVSATFEPIVERAMELHSFHHQISTRMKVDSTGNYTRKVEGEPIEGIQKLCVVKAFADQRYGKEGWELAYAYGDHHSDTPLLAAATRPFAVTPDSPLARTAKRKGWEILDWGKSEF